MSLASSRVTGIQTLDSPVSFDSSDDTLSRLKSILKLQSALAGNIDEIAMFNELDETFHRSLFEAAGQLGLYELIRLRGGHMARARRLDLPRKGRMLDIVAAHKDIVEAIEQEDVQTADKQAERKAAVPRSQILGH